MRSIGDDFEEKAIALLRDNGLEILTRNYTRKAGEIDIIARDGQYLVFVEVRARSHKAFSGAAGSVDYRKQQRLIRTAQLYLQSHPQWSNSPCRFDVIAFEPRQSAQQRPPNWIRSAFIA
ncbi:MAG: putative endonuclease [Halioglobus sp.]|jgi:putative endonuclease